jgi:hypothetical protein
MPMLRKIEVLGEVDEVHSREKVTSGEGSKVQRGSAETLGCWFDSGALSPDFLLLSVVGPVSMRHHW